MTQITIEREKLGQVLAALKRMKGYGDTFAYRSSEQNPYQQVCEALEVCEQAITAPVQEPVGTYGEVFESMLALLRTGLQSDQQIYMAMKDKPLYTTPPAAQRQWVGLTEDEIDQAWNNTDGDVARAIEAKLKAKNGFDSTEKNT